LTGRVFSGKGEGRNYLKLPWVKQQIKDKLDFIPFPGTLNLRLAEQSFASKEVLEKMKSATFCQDEGYCVGILFNAVVNGLADLNCAVLIPMVENYPVEVLEVISPVNLRGTLRLKDGDLVTVQIQTVKDS
jgi:riboflavin kinase